MLRNFNRRRKESTNIISIEDVKKYRVDPTVFWSRFKHLFPGLSRLWRRVAVVAAASADVGRVFSIAGWITSARRWNLSDESVRAIILNHMWSGLLF